MKCALVTRNAYEKIKVFTTQEVRRSAAHWFILVKFFFTTRPRKKKKKNKQKHRHQNNVQMFRLTTEYTIVIELSCRDKKTHDLTQEAQVVWWGSRIRSANTNTSIHPRKGFVTPTLGSNCAKKALLRLFTCTSPYIWTRWSRRLSLSFQ